MSHMNFFWFWTSESATQTWTHAQTTAQTTVSTVKVDKISHKLISSWTWDVLLFWVLFISILFAFLFKKIA